MRALVFFAAAALALGVPAAYAPSTPSGTVTLASDPVRIDGGAPGDLAGTSVAGVGDQNGDGRPDVAVGAPGNGGGYAYVSPGGSSGYRISRDGNAGSGLVGRRDR